MAVFSTVYISAAIALFKSHFGDESLVYANILNLLVRIVYSVRFINAFYRRRNARQLLKWSTVFPHWSLIAVGGLSVLVVRLSGHRLGIRMAEKGGERISLSGLPALLHVMIGVSMAMACLIIWWMTSGRYLKYSIHSKRE